MTTTTRPLQYRPFTVDHLLQAGLIRDLGQLSHSMRVALEKRAAAGEVTKEVSWPEGHTIYRVVRGVGKAKGRAA